MMAIAEVKGTLPAADPHFGHGHAHEEEHSEPAGAAVPCRESEAGSDGERSTTS